MPLLCAISQFACAINSRRQLHADERITAAPLDHALKMSLLDHAAPRILPRLFDERVQVPRTSGRLRFPLGAMLSSGSGAFGVSSAMSQPPGFTDSPAGTSPDQGRRKRRAYGARLLSPFLR